MSGLSRRRFLFSVSSLPLVTLLRQCGIPLEPDPGADGLAGADVLTGSDVLTGADGLAGSDGLASSGATTRGAATFRFFTIHQADVVREATARLIPGPDDDNRERGHPGAREANVVQYIDNFLSAFSSNPPLVFAGGPFSDRAGGTTNDMATFIPLNAVQQRIWSQRLVAIQEVYLEGIATLDYLAGGDFSQTSPDQMDHILAAEQAAEFRDVLFTHAIEGMYSPPEYGGNQGLVGWSEIGFPGDCQPTGYNDLEVSQSDGPDPVGPRSLTQKEFEAVLPLLARRRAHGWKR